MQNVTLNNGVEMPILGFGVYQIDDKNVCEESVYNALMEGYRLIDTAAVYSNEKAVGRAIKQSGVSREEILVTTKLWIQDTGYKSARKAFETSLKKLQLDYLDLYFIHMPFGDIHGSWRAMEELYHEGKIRAIGVSNFLNDRLMDLIVDLEIVPTVNQVGTHVFTQQVENAQFMKDHHVQIESWGPFAEGKNNIFKIEVLASMAEKHHKSVAQVDLRWLIQRGIFAIPKSVHKERIIESFNIFNFELSREDMERIATLDSKESLILSLHDPENVEPSAT
ncbi:aldo/keto reductase [Paenibacillus sp. Lou8.1]|uniref:aldo/keto reductase n=1 Tax=Paenibacillus sp. Lou8.1 TaxID=2962041 RepID=UPI0020B81FFC|nr:aldo/keto reductase [Paenibacillus sp. Lou8.1]MCP3809903.1 aldo/keto reductase [Paenibacillus sp. Lou8.1]